MKPQWIDPTTAVLAGKSPVKSLYAVEGSRRRDRVCRADVPPGRYLPRRQNPGPRASALEHERGPGTVGDRTTMNPVSAATDRARVIALLRYIASVLTSEGDRNWILGVKNVLAVAEDERLADPEALKLAAASFQRMFGPAGFGDFFVWRDTVEQRREANRPYQAAMDELWKLLVKARSSTG